MQRFFTFLLGAYFLYNFHYLDIDIEVLIFTINRHLSGIIGPSYAPIHSVQTNTNLVVRGEYNSCVLKELITLKDV